MLQEILKQETNTQHDNLEKLMFVGEIMNGTLSVEQYKEILITNYVIHAGFEQQLFNKLSFNLSEELDLKSRVKLPALLEDLRELNIAEPEVFLRKNSPDFIKNDAAILGAMYVMEGATLGGNVIVKKLKVNPNLQKLNLGFHYYQIYGTDLIFKWKQFCKVLNDSVPVQEYHASISSALKLFEYFALAQENNNSVSTLSAHKLH